MSLDVGRVVPVDKRTVAVTAGQRSEEARPGRMVFELWRLDDNGNEFLVEAFDEREAAEEKIAGLAAGGHRQTYWLKETIR